MTTEAQPVLMDETDVTNEKAWYYGESARATVATLIKRNINAYFAPTRQEALSLIMGLIPEGATVGLGDSVTLHQVGITPALRRRNRNVILDPVRKDHEGNYLLDQESMLEMMRRIFTVDVFLLGANAITRDGKIVNIDGRGNRVAPALFGPKKVIYVAGTNKLVRNLEEAMDRIFQVAAPLNTRRHFSKRHWSHLADLPCMRTGFCSRCNVTKRACRQTVIIEGAVDAQRDRNHVVLVGEELGL